MSDFYPIDILPRFVYKPRMRVNNLLAKYPELLVVRLVDGNPEDYSIETESGELVLSEKVFKNNMANLSMNLAGGLFDTAPEKHLRFLPVKDLVKPWKGFCVRKNVCSEDDSFQLFVPCFGLCFLVRDIHERTFPYYKHFDTEEERNQYAKEVAEIIKGADGYADADYVGAFKSKKDLVEVHPRIRVHHSPSNANYWHMTLDTYRPNEATYIKPEGDQKSTDKKMFKALKQDLLQNYTINSQPLYRIEESDYYLPFFYLLKKCFEKIM